MPPILDPARMLGLFGVTFLVMNLWKSVGAVTSLEVGRATFAATYLGLALYIAWHAPPGWLRRAAVYMAIAGALAGAGGALALEPAYHAGILLLAPACLLAALAMLWAPTTGRLASSLLWVFIVGHAATTVEAAVARVGPILHAGAVTQLGMRQGPWSVAIVPAGVLLALAAVLLVHWRRGLR